MFFFGSPESTLELYLENSLALSGPDLPSRNFEELNNLQQKALFTYVYIAYADALNDGVDDEPLAAIMKLYDDLFYKLAKASPEFRDAVRSGRHNFLPDYSETTRAKYLGLVEDSAN